MRAPCDRSGRSAWLKVVPGLTPDSIPQKYGSDGHVDVDHAHPL